MRAAEPALEPAREATPGRAAEAQLEPLADLGADALHAPWAADAPAELDDEPHDDELVSRHGVGVDAPQGVECPHARLAPPTAEAQWALARAWTAPEAADSAAAGGSPAGPTRRRLLLLLPWPGAALEACGREPSPTPGASEAQATIGVSSGEWETDGATAEGVRRDDARGTAEGAPAAVPKAAFGFGLARLLDDDESSIEDAAPPLDDGAARRTPRMSTAGSGALEGGPLGAPADDLAAAVCLAALSASLTKRRKSASPVPYA